MSMDGRRRAGALSLAAALAIGGIGLACSDQEGPTPATPALPEEATSPMPSEVSAPAPLDTEEGAGIDGAEFDQPPADIQQQQNEMVRCLVDSPPGCDGCDLGDTCVYEEMSKYNCVYVVYGTDCSET